MQSLKEQSETLRYERKFLITDYSHLDVEQIIKFHPACFSEIFEERTVNNIYFDTLGLTNYFDNIDGSQNRLKVRIRWYGELFGQISKPVLEYKIKKGLMGKKESHLLQSFILDEKFDKSQIEMALENASISLEIKNELLSLKPYLLNNYKRKYFLSANKKFRITIDHHLTYYAIGYNGNNFINKSIDYSAVVMELKYDASDEDEAKNVGSQLPFKMTKNSKYLQGLERVFI